MRGSDVCVSHAGVACGGAPAGNQNRSEHGFYSRYFSDDEMAVMLRPVDDLKDEIALCRVLTSRLMNVLSGSDIATDDVVKLSSLALRSAAVMSRLMKDQKVLSGAAADDLSSAIGQVLDQLSAEWGVCL
jgi:hypothetical protein